MPPSVLLRVLGEVYDLTERLGVHPSRDSVRFPRSGEKGSSFELRGFAFVQGCIGAIDRLGRHSNLVRTARLKLGPCLFGGESC